MKKTMGVIATALFLFACVDEGKEKPPTSQQPCVGDACEQPCVPETMEELCEEAGVACGELQATDRCGVVSFVSCGTCGPDHVCRERVCVEMLIQEPLIQVNCDVVPDRGVCAGFRVMLRCTGEGEEAELVRETCDLDESCVETAAGAACEPIPCEQDVQLCTPEGNLKRCQDGEFVESPCEFGCAQVLGYADCRSSLGGQTVLQRSRLLYEHRHPNRTLTNWAAPTLEPAAEMSIYYTRGGSAVTWATTDEDGYFELLIPETRQPGEGLMVLAVSARKYGESFNFGVVDPALPPGRYPTGQTGEGAYYWTWSFSDLRTNEIVIRESDGSSAIQIHQNVAKALGVNAAHGGHALRPLRAVYGQGVDYDCGACYSRHFSPTVGWMFLSGGSFRYDQSDSVILHESGHHAFANLGPEEHGETGSHCLGVPAPPGQALNEGHASWYSSDLRQDSKLYTKQLGTFSYWDIGAKAPAYNFSPPDREGGLDLRDPLIFSF